MVFSAYMDNFSRDKCGPYIWNWVYHEIELALSKTHPKTGSLLLKEKLLLGGIHIWRPHWGGEGGLGQKKM